MKHNVECLKRKSVVIGSFCQWWKSSVNWKGIKLLLKSNMLCWCFTYTCPDAHSLHCNTSAVAHTWGWHPPLLVRSIQGGFRRYAVRKGLVRSTQKFCYIVRRHQFLLSKGPLFIKKHITRDKLSQITPRNLRARFARVFLPFQHL